MLREKLRKKSAAPIHWLSLKRSGFVLLALLGALVSGRWQQAQESTTRQLAPTAAVSKGEPLPLGREAHTATLLNNGKLLVVGGRNPNEGAADSAGALRDVQLYDPATGRWSEVKSLSASRFGHSAALLPNGRVLIAGGRNASGFLSSAELYDPETSEWTATGSLATPRARATSNLLALAVVNQSGAAGSVLLVGGENSNGALNTAELFNPTEGKWRMAGNALSAARVEHSTTLLPNGSVLVAGGRSTATGAALASCELYDPLTNKWASAGALNAARAQHSATLLPSGRLLVAGGTSNGTSALTTAEFYDAAKQSWTTSNATLTSARRNHSASLLPNGKLLLVGGFNASGTPLSSSESYDSNAQKWSSDLNFNEQRARHTATLLANARVLIVGGTPDGSAVHTSTESYDPANASWALAKNPLNFTRHSHTATLLPNGKVLVAGGQGTSGALRRAELYDPVSGTWEVTADLNVARSCHSATLLPNGKVLVVGGEAGSPLRSVELYDPATGGWTVAKDLNVTRSQHTATLLPNGRVLVAGGVTVGFPSTTITKTVEIYDPSAETWTSVRDMKETRAAHTATLLFDGRVLVAGGATANSQTSLNTAELYDVNANTWTATLRNLNIARLGHTATLLPNGKVLVVAGLRGTDGANPTNISGSAELFDPSRQVWDTTTAPTGRVFHSATLLLNGKVLLAGGRKFQSSTVGIVSTPEAELYDPARGTSVPFTSTVSLKQARGLHTATLLPNGQVLVAGGEVVTEGSLSPPPTDSAELYDLGLEALTTSAPTLSDTAWQGIGAGLRVTGIRFQGAGEATTGGAVSSPANYPVVQIRRLDNEQTLYLLPEPTQTQTATAAGWSNNDFNSRPVLTNTQAGAATGFAAGPALLTLFANGVPNTTSVMLLPGVTPSDTETGTITGRVHDVTDAPLTATLTLRSSTGEVKTLTTGPNGEYAFPDLPKRTPRQSLLAVKPESFTAGGGTTSLTVTGAGFLSNSTVLWNGLPRTTQFDSATQLRATISANDLGTSGFASLAVSTLNPDGKRFVTRPLTVTIAPPATPPPSLSELSPSSTTAGNQGFTLTVAGANFTTNSVVRWNGSNRTTTFVSSRILTAAIPASDLTQAGSASVTVNTPNVGTSNALAFTISAAGPVISSLSPNAATLNATPSAVTVTGSGFASNSTILWNGATRTINATASAPPTRLVFTPLTSDLQTGRVNTVQVFNPTTNSTSNAASFTVSNPGPTLSYLSPVETTVSTGLTVALIGTNFVSGALVQVNGANRTPSSTTSTRLQTTLSANDLSAPRVLELTASNPTPGGGQTNSLCLAVSPTYVNGDPIIGQVTPFAAYTGGGVTAQTLTVLGNFPTGSSVQWDGSTRTTTRPNASTLVAALTTSDLSQTGVHRVSVISPQGRPSNTFCFVVRSASPTVTSTEPASFCATNASATLAVNGVGFVSGAQIRWNGVARTTTFVSANRVQATISAAERNVSGLASVSVVNPNGNITNTVFVDVQPCIGAPPLEWRQSPQLVTTDSTLTSDAEPATLTDAEPATLTEFTAAAMRLRASNAALLRNALAPAQSQPPDAPITYTVTPAATAPNGRAMTFDPPLRTVENFDDAAELGFAARRVNLVRAPLTGKNQDFCAGPAAYTIGGTISNLTPDVAAVTFTLTNNRANCSFPTDTLRNSAAADGGYTFDQGVVNGVYRLTPASTGYSFAPTEITLPALTTGGAIGQNFTATRAVTCPVSTTATNSAPSGLVCAGGSVSLMTPSISGATYSWTGPNGFTSNQQNPTLANLTPAASGVYTVTVSVSGCASTVQASTNLTVNIFSLSNTNAAYSAASASGFVDVTALVSACAWTASSNDAWLTLASGSSGNGNGRVTFNVAANASANARTGSLTIAGQNFTVMQAGVTATPALTSISPTQVFAGGPTFTLTVNGANLLNGSTVRVNGNNRATNYVSDAQLTAQILASDIATAGQLRISVAAPGGSPVSNEITLTVANEAFAVSAASFMPGSLAPDSIVALFGTGLATGTQTATTLPLPTQLLNTRVTVRDSVGTTRAAALFFVSPNQINCLVPSGTATGTASLTITAGDGTISGVPIEITATAPGLFSANASGQGVPAAILLRVFSNNTQRLEPVGSYDTATNRYVPVPINLGPEGERVYLILFGTGIRYRANLGTVSATLGGTATPVDFAAQQGDLVGVDQVNLGPLPRSLAGRGNVNLNVSVEGRAANPLQITVQ